MIEYTTTIKKDSDGWSCRSQPSARTGEGWSISTYKSGKAIRSSFQAGRFTEEGNWSFIMFQDKNITLGEIPGKGTEKAIKEAHEKALEIAKEKGLI